MCLEEVGLRRAEGRGLQEDQIAFRWWEVRFLSRSSAGVQQEAQSQPADHPQSKGHSTRRLRVTWIPTHEGSIHET